MTNAFVRRGLHRALFFSVERPWQALGLCLLIVIGFGAGLRTLSISADTRAYFPPDGALRQTLDRFEQRYAEQNNLLLVFHSNDDSLFTEERIALIDSITEEAWKIPYTTRVDSITNATHIAADGDMIKIDPMIDAARTNIGAPLDMDVLRSLVLGDNLLVNRLVSPDGRTTAININVQYPRASTTASGTVIAAADAMVAAFAPQTLGLSVWKTGRVATSNAFSAASKQDLKTLTPLSYLVIVILLMVLLRSVPAAAALFSTILLAIVCSLGLAGWMGLQINSATASSPTIIMALGVAAIIHVVISFLHAFSAGDDRRMSIRRALGDDIKPVALTLCTTAIGFLTLNSADAPPFQELGTIIAAGALFSLLFGVLWLPAMLRLLPIKRPRTRGIIDRFVRGFAQRVIRYRTALLVATPILIALSAMGMARITIDDNYVRYFDKRFEFRTDTDQIITHLTGLDQLEFDVGGERDRAVLDPAYFAKLEAFETWLKAQPRVTYVASVAETFRRLNKHLHAGEEAFYRIPENAELLAQYLMLYEMSLPLGRTLTDQITIDRNRSRVTVIMRGASTREIQALQNRAERWLATHAPTAITGEGTGLAVMFSYLSSLNIKSMIGGTLIALIIISAILTLAFRSIGLGLLSLVPNLFPVLIAFGVWGALVGRVGVAISAVGAMTLGIIVDDTVHLLWRYREARLAGKDKPTAVHAMFKKVGRPMLTSSLILIAGFCVVATSGFHVTSAMGMLSAMIILIALLADWLFLPPLLLLLDRQAMAKNHVDGPNQRGHSQLSPAE
ncbi:MAG: MMPL family transporter [Pseudomonadota bacterium]